MDEKFLHYLWKFRLLFPHLRLINGESLTVLHPGNHNPDGGPDFFNARIRISNTTWAGNIEVHLRSSDWFRHGHDQDKAYDSVILHVVFEFDREIFTSENRLIPTLEIKNQYPEIISINFNQIMANHQQLPCRNLLVDMNKQEFSLWMPGLVLERLKKKSEVIFSLWTSCENDWEESFYRFLALNFGFRINSLPFELTAKALPQKILSRSGDDLFQKEAFLFGVSGLVAAGFKDDYPQKLFKEFAFLREKYNLSPITLGLWKFLRLRPSNFPTIRLSQWACFLNRHKGKMMDILLGQNPAQWIDTFTISASEYWDDHYTFDKISASERKTLGRKSIDLLMVNALIPFLYFYSLRKSLPELAEKAICFLDNIQGEFNSDIKIWESNGMPVKTALNTQALLHLKRSYCDEKRCLECRIGLKIFKSDSYEKDIIGQGLPVI